MCFSLFLTEGIEKLDLLGILKSWPARKRVKAKSNGSSCVFGSQNYFQIKISVLHTEKTQLRTYYYIPSLWFRQIWFYPFLVLHIYSYNCSYLTVLVSPGSEGCCLVGAHWRCLGTQRFQCVLYRCLRGDRGCSPVYLQFTKRNITDRVFNWHERDYN